MEREVGQAASIAITLLAISALISIVWVTLVIGNSVKINAADEGNKIRNNMATSQLKSLKNTENTIIPLAAAYNLISQESGVVNSLTITDKAGYTSYVNFVEGKWVLSGARTGSFMSLESVIADDISGKVEIEVIQSEADTFDVKLTELGY